MRNRIFIVIAIFATLCGSLRAADVNITFDGKQKLYFNARPSWIPTPKWDDASAVFSAYFYGASGSQFAGKAEQIDGLIYAVKVPAGSWHHVIFTRHAPSTTTFDFNGGHGFWNESQPIALKQYQWDNYISEFNIKNDGSDPYCEWNKLYSEQPKNGTTPAALASYWGLTIENISVCDNTEGDPFTLTPNTIDQGAGKYAYNYDMRAHAWFKSTNNGTTWTNVDGKAGTRNSSEEGEMNYNGEKVGAKNSVTYYYLYAKEANDQRLICVTVNKNCEVSCEITSFEITPTAVNVGDNTYTMDGIVAFTKAEGSLIIECDGKQTTIASPESPQAFSLPGLAADGQPETFRAYFSNAGSCEMIKNTTAPLPTSDATTHADQTIAPLDALTLTPTADGTNSWEWTLGDAIVKQSPAANNQCPVTTYDHDTTVTYVYTEYNPLPTLPTNLMYNGDFEDVSVPFHWHTGYKNSNMLNSNKIWDGTTADQKNIYDNTLEDPSDPSLKDNEGHYYVFKNKYGFFGVTTNANTYWKLMSRIAPKDGSYMAVIDGDEVANRQAWYASTSDNPNLKLTRGTTYLFSFWVANINNFGELINNGHQNCAKLQFHIKCHSVEENKWYEADLGQPIDLNEAKYMDLNWHQNSSTFSTRAYFGKDFDADDVTISVVDKNQTGLTIGNDFALDDIQFRAISVVSKSIKAREFFKVIFYETPTVVEQPAITIKQTPACGMTDFTMDVKVDYSALNNKYPVTLQLTDNVYGPLFATPITIDPAVNPTSITLTLPTATYAMLVADGAVHTLTAKITRIDGAGVDKGGENSNTYTAPGVPAINTPVLTVTEPSCDKTTFDIQVAADYRAFKGAKLHYEWDGAEWTNSDLPTLSYKEATWQTATGKLKDLPADGLNHTLRVYSDTTIDCEYTFATVAAPVVPAIDTVKTAYSTLACTDMNTTLTFDLAYTYQQGALTYWVDGLSPQTATYSVADKTKQTLTDLSFANIPADGKSHVLHVSFDGANSCIKSYNLPAAPFSPVINSVTVASVPATVPCDANDYTITVTIVTPYDATGRNIKLSGAKDTTVVTTGTSTVVTIKKTDIGGAAQTVTAAYEATPTCTQTSASFTPPTRTACAALRDTICEGEDYTKNGFNIIAPPIGEAMYLNSVNDTLYLVVADGHSMLSKWTDVLFIDNSDGLFVSYQWYENGYLMLNETQQRLYNPNGLAGKYYCRMTTTDGKIIYTCEQDFDDVTPSRSVNSSAPAAVINRYRVSPHVYIIQERIGDEVVTRKILTPYE